MRCPICDAPNAGDAAACRACAAPFVRTAAPAPPHTLGVGTSLNGGAFSVGRVLGQGGFGITYAGTELRLRRLVAIKECFPLGCRRQGTAVMPAETGAAELQETVRCFLEEACVLARFQHPGIVRVHAAFEENNTAYMVMEHLEGRSLEGLLRERRRLPEAEAVGLVERIADALTAVHEAGLLHRDIKPDNVMLAGDGRVVLLDFGAAREFAAGKTRQMTQILTAPYAPLEQWGSRARFGRPTDVYALAATLYHLLTGELPVPAPDRAAGVELPEPRRLNPAVTSGVSDAVMRGMAIQVDSRPQTAAAFVEALRGPGARSSKPPAPSRAQRSGRGPSGTAAGGGGAAASPERCLVAHRGLVEAVAFSPDGRLVASGGEDATVRLWDPAGGTEVRRIQGLDGDVWGLAFRPDGLVLAGGSAGTLRLWEVATGRELGRWTVGDDSVIWRIAYSPDGSLLAAADLNGSVALWEPAAGGASILTGHADLVRGVAFSPDGGVLASGSRDETVILWDVRKTRGWLGGARTTVSLQCALKPAEACGRKAVRDERACGVLGVAFHPSGRLVASAGWDTFVRLWSVERRCEVMRLAAHTAPVNCVAFSPCGLWAASGSQDATVRLWNAATGAEARVLKGHSGAVTSVAFSGRGRLIASAGADGTVRLWSLGQA